MTFLSKTKKTSVATERNSVNTDVNLRYVIHYNRISKNHLKYHKSTRQYCRNTRIENRINPQINNRNHMQAVLINAHSLCNKTGLLLNFFTLQSK